jgi:hypothetical protein
VEEDGHGDMIPGRRGIIEAVPLAVEDGERAGVDAPQVVPVVTAVLLHQRLNMMDSI